MQGIRVGFELGPFDFTFGANKLFVTIDLPFPVNNSLLLFCVVQDILSASVAQFCLVFACIYRSFLAYVSLALWFR